VKPPACGREDVGRARYVPQLSAMLTNNVPLGAQALTHADDGTPAIPSSNDDWLDWVSASATRNCLLDDTLVDWLDRYGTAKGFQRDSERPGYDARTDFTTFIFGKANAFETAVVAHLQTLTGVERIAAEHGDSRSLTKAEETVRAMLAGVPIIYQPVLRDAQNRTYGVPDLLVRSDELRRLFPELLLEADASQSAAALGGAPWHYRIVDIKFTTLELLSDGQLGNGGSKLAYKGQLYIYNRALGRIQGFLAPASYLLGRRWTQTVKSVTYRGKSCRERLGPVPQYSTVKGQPLASAVDEAVAWIRRLRRTGENWAALPEPTVPELRPNMGADGGAWTDAKRQIAHELQELTLLWYVGAEKRRLANQLGVYRWNDPQCTAASLGVTGAKTQPVLQALLDINRTDHQPVVAPAKVTAAEAQWRREPPLEFYVDFETVSDLDDDFTTLPDCGGQPLIFMIGCGHVENSDWRFQCFVVEALTEACEEAIIDAWLAHMRQVREHLSPSGEEPPVIHWSPAETSNIRDAYNAAIQRHPAREKDWSAPRWFDFLKHVIKSQPVVVRGAWGFGLKAITQAIYEHGLINTQWTSGPTDGLGAMVGAWSCAHEAAGTGASLRQLELMKGIESYNEVDCKAMMEIVRYLRTKH